jgi:hypothetical protein
MRQAPTLFQLSKAALASALSSPDAKMHVTNMDEGDMLWTLETAHDWEVSYLPTYGKLTYRDWEHTDVPDVTLPLSSTTWRTRLEYQDDGAFSIRVDHVDVLDFWLSIQVPSELDLTVPGTQLRCEGRVSGLDAQASTRLYLPLLKSNHFIASQNAKPVAVVASFDGTTSVVQVTTQAHVNFHLEIEITQEKLRGWREHIKSQE